MIIDYRKIHGNEYGFPPWLMEKLKCPAAGEGVHRWIYRVGLSLRHYVERDEAEEIVAEYMTRKEKPPGEIYESLSNAYEADPDDFDHHSNGDWTPSDQSRHCPSCVKHVYDCWKGEKSALQTLKDCSNPIPNFERIIHRLYADEEWICVGAADINEQGVLWGYTAYTVKAKTAIENQAWCWSQIVPNPMRTEAGFTQAGEESYRSKANACADRDRKYAVTDFDFTLEGSFGEVIRYVMDKEKLEARDAIHEITARLILYIAKRDPHIPLVMVVDSGGKSLHAWWDVYQLDESDQSAWFHNTVPYGTDSSIFKSNNHFVRMPFGLREVTGVIQSVIYWGL